MSKPITNEKLAEMRARCIQEGSSAAIFVNKARIDLPRCIAEIERLKEDVSTLRQLREYDAKELLEYRLRTSPLTDPLS